MYARRKGRAWFIAVMNGEHQEKTITINFSFLKPGNYRLMKMEDDKEKQAGVVVHTEMVKAKATMTINLNPEGGFVARIEK